MKEYRNEIIFGIMTGVIICQFMACIWLSNLYNSTKPKLRVNGAREQYTQEINGKDIMCEFEFDHFISCMEVK